MQKKLFHFELKETKRYDLFKLYKENRDVNINKVKQYKESIKEKGLKQPISVKYKNGFYYITDGQHRYFALMELGYCIIFIVDYDSQSTSEDIIDINANRSNTKTLDYIHFWATKKIPEFIKMNELHNKYPNIKNTLLNEIFIKSKMPKNPTYKVTDNIKKGNIEIDYKQGETVLDWLQKIEKSNGQSNLYQSKIARAFRYIYNNNENFNINLFCNKISNTEIIAENNEYRIVTSIKEKYNKRIRQNNLLLV